MTKRWIGGVFLGALVAVGCGGGSGRPTGPYDASCTLPANITFTGNWYTNLGRMELSQNGAVVAGSWRDDQSHKTGRIEGNAQGCLLLFSWNQTDDTIPGRPRTTNGRGVFHLVVPAPDARDQTLTIEGVWGYGTEVEGGGNWTGRRLRD